MSEVRLDRQWSLVLLLGAALGMATGCEDTCESPGDCRFGELCVGGVCEPRRPGVLLVTDGGPAPDAVADTGVPTATVADGGMRDSGPPTDTGPLPDTGPPPDAGSLPAVDAGQTYDAGFPPATTLQNRGFVWLGDIREAFGPSFRAEALFQRNMSATHSVFLYEFDLGTEGSCAVTRQSLASGMPTGLDARDIEITFATNPFNPSPMVLGSRGRGLFTFVGNITPPLLIPNTGDVVFQINSNMMMGTLDDHMIGLPQPPPINVSTPSAPEVPFMSIGPGLVTWTPSTEVGQMMTLEMLDAPENVVLKCVTPDDGMFVIPQDARTAWLLSGPATPAWLDVRYDVSRLEQVRIVGGGMAATEFRVSQGARFQVF